MGATFGLGYVATKAISWPVVKFYGLWDGWLWKIVQYLGIPLYVFGIMMALSFSSGYIIMIGVFIALYYLYISKILYKTDPIEAHSQNNNE
jgi:hypothetical protein